MPQHLQPGDRFAASCPNALAAVQAASAGLITAQQVPFAVTMYDHGNPSCKLPVLLDSDQQWDSAISLRQAQAQAHVTGHVQEQKQCSN